MHQDLLAQSSKNCKCPCRVGEKQEAPEATVQNIHKSGCLADESGWVGQGIEQEAGKQSSIKRGI
jgi:hypothetical protein